ncbi:hypothetical protein VM1G_05869 [Cytospora mali]|uniref:Uncharacterized protein n=1 Tax=Cytospora mali TaxID=578113 RepID=A0A194W4D2_CYTMA|nr:hypothetical protein VM1G_05869 [Valsa mali]
MLFKALLTLLTATLAVAAPSKRQDDDTGGLSVELTNTVLAVSADYRVSTNGTAVPVNFPFTVDLVTVTCVEICIPEYHCTLYDTNYTPFITVPPGTTEIQPPTEVGLIICGGGLPEKKREVQPSTPAARRTGPYDGVAVFSNEETGYKTGFGFHIGETISLGDRTKYYTNATVQDVNAPVNERWNCEAFDENGGSLGIFFASDRFIYSFVPGVVASFLCD